MDLPKHALPGDQYNALIKIVKRRTGMDLKGYREGVAQRRIARRARAVGCDNVEKYLEYLAGHLEEAFALVQLITIQVSQFFRNPEVFRVMDLEVLPEIFSGKEEGEPVKIWSAGCAEGEELYSTAILLLEHHNRRLKDHPAKLLGTDISPESLETARRGRYEGKSLELVDDLLKRRYFRQKDGMWEVRPVVRKMVEFRHENLFTGQGVEDVDLILARNLLIYFDRERQEKILRRLLASLKQGGHLVLGKSETMPANLRDAVSPVKLRERVYKKN